MELYEAKLLMGLQSILFLDLKMPLETLSAPVQNIVKKEFRLLVMKVIFVQMKEWLHQKNVPLVFIQVKES